MDAMTDAANSTGADQPEQKGPGSRTGSDIWIRRIAVVLVALVIAWIAFEMLAAYLPRSWAQRVGRQVDGSLSSGIFWGLFYGFVFSFVGLLVASLALSNRIGWIWKPVIVLVGLACALPNLLTLWVVIGNSSAAHAGERIFDVDAPGFRAATMFGVVGGVLLGVVLVWIVLAARRRKGQVTDLKGQLAQRDSQATAEPDESNDDREEKPHA